MYHIKQHMKYKIYLQPYKIFHFFKLGITTFLLTDYLYFNNELLSL